MNVPDVGVSPSVITVPGRQKYFDSAIIQYEVRGRSTAEGRYKERMSGGEYAATILREREQLIRHSMEAKRMAKSEMPFALHPLTGYLSL